MPESAWENVGRYWPAISGHEFRLFHNKSSVQNQMPLKNFILHMCCDSTCRGISTLQKREGGKFQRELWCSVEIQSSGQYSASL